MTWTAKALAGLKVDRARLVLLSVTGRLNEDGETRLIRVDFAMLYLWERAERTGVVT